MQAALWKLDHPCFFDFFCFRHACDDFRLCGGLFFLYRFDDTVFGLCSELLVSQRLGTHHCSKFALWNNICIYRKTNHTIGSEFGQVTEWACLRSCKQPEDVVKEKYVEGASGWSQQLFFKARRWLFGLFLLCPLMDERGFFNPSRIKYVSNY